MVPMIILQTAAVIHEVCRTRFADAGFVEFQDYVLTDDPSAADEAITAGNGRQLLVTGTFGGDHVAADQFVQSMKVKQPGLRAISFSVYTMRRPPYPYDVSINKYDKGSFDRLVTEMHSFMQGVPST